MKCTPVDLGEYAQFESLSVKVVGGHQSIVVVCVYRPPGEVTSPCLDELSNLFDQLTLLGCQFTVVGDFNVPGSIAGQLDHRAANVFAQHGLTQHVSTPTHVSGNVLDLILTRDDDASCKLVSQVATSSVCFSDHHLITSQLGVVLMTYSYRQTHKIDTAVFCNDILCSRLYDSTTTDADEYAELFDDEVRRVLDVHAPLRSCLLYTSPSPRD